MTDNNNSRDYDGADRSITLHSELPIMDEKEDLGFLQEQLGKRKKVLIGAASLLVVVVIGVVAICSSTGSSQESSQKSEAVRLFT